jgi:ketosteroid isomerase-like protein
MRFIVAHVLLLLAAPTWALTPEGEATAPLPSVELPKALDRVLRDYERAWQARDPAALAALFAEDGFVLANGEPPVRGRARIREAYKDGGGSLSLRALAYATEGPVGYIIGAYGPGAGEKDTGKFVLALRREKDGRWSIAADMDNSSQHRPRSPAPAPPQD